MLRVGAPHSFDIAFLGSGIACSMTLLEWSEALLNSPQPPKKLRIAVVERHEQFWCGIPYGARTSRRSLAIQKFDEFVAEPERSAYIAWLQRTKPHWLSSLQEHGGAAAARWVDDNRSALDANQWGEIYLPRYLFGAFIAEQVAAAITALGDLVEVVTIQAEAVSAEFTAGRHVIGLRLPEGGAGEIAADTVVVAIGSPPPKTILDSVAEPPFAYVNDIYSPDEDTNLEWLREVLGRADPSDARNVLIVGSNASSLEALYLIRHDERLRELVESITVVSRSGMLPYKICEQPPEFEFPCLNELLAAETVDAKGLMSAIRSDLDTAEARSLNLADLYAAIGALVGQGLRAMDIVQQEEFHCVHGMTYTKLVRRAGRDCRQASEELVSDGVLTMLAGEVLSVQACATGRPLAALRYRAAGVDYIHPKSFAAVVNCGGFEELDACSSPLLSSIIDNGLGRPNRTNRGLLVNDDFEASPRFFVIGPLIGGNFTSTLRYWHVESAPRIRMLAKSLAAVLARSLNQSLVRTTTAGEP